MCFLQLVEFVPEFCVLALGHFDGPLPFGRRPYWLSCWGSWSNTSCRVERSVLTMEAWGDHEGKTRYPRCDQREREWRSHLPPRCGFRPSSRAVQRFHELAFSVVHRER